MQRKLLIIGFLLLVVFGLITAVYRSFEANKSKLELPVYKKTTIYINSRPIDVEVADNLVSRTVGLSGRNDLDSGKGMLFVFDGAKTVSSFWMKNMKFPIDIVWIADGRVVGTSEGLLPEENKIDRDLKRYSPPQPVDMVLEVNAGIVPTMNIKSGDIVSVKISSNKQPGGAKFLLTPEELSGQK